MNILQRTLLAAASALLLLFMVSPSQAQRCENGLAGVYPCHLVDQLSELLLPTFAGAANTNDVWGWTNPDTGREFVALGLRNGMAFIDITTPTKPLYIGFMPTQTTESLWRDVEVYNGYAIVGSEASGHGLQIFDMRRLESVPRIETPKTFFPDAIYPGFGNSHTVSVNTETGYAYALGSNTFAGGLHIVNINNPQAPVFAGGAEFDGYTHDGQAVVYQGPDADYTNKELFFAYNENTLTIWDVSDKSNVEMVSRTAYDLVGYTHQGWLTEDHRYLLMNDELDEMNFNINTRTIVWDVQDIENPIPIGYVDHGTTCIDHNLYIVEGMSYMSNYTCGLRIHDMNSVHLGLINEFGHFDVFPQGDPRIFSGTWANYPWFKSEVVAVASMFNGVHFVRPRYAELESKYIRNCGGASASTQVPFDFNKPVTGVVNYSAQISGGQVTAGVGVPFTLGSPFSNNLVLGNLNNTAPGYYPGKVTISHGSAQRELPFVVLQHIDNPTPPQPIFPTNGIILNTQDVLFEVADEWPGYAKLQIAVDVGFVNIVYEREYFGSGTTFAARVPYSQTAYYWRIVKPTSCGEDVVSQLGYFLVGLVTSTSDAAVRGEVSLQGFPNPATDELNVIGFGANGTVLRLCDLSGRLLGTWQVPAGSGSFSIPVSQLSKGMYILQAEGVSGAALRFAKH